MAPRVTLLIATFEPDAAVVSLVAALRARGFADIVVVDDGSPPTSVPILAALESACWVIRLPERQGKGRALKTGLDYCRRYGPDALGVVTVDADGRHDPADVEAVAAALAAQPARLIIGQRRVAEARLAWSRRLGLDLTRAVLAITAGVRLADPLCGLRALPAARLAELAAVPGDGCEYELNALVAAGRGRWPLAEVPIAAVAVDGPRARGFDPLRDSFALAFLLLRFTLASAVCAAVDLGLFAALARGGTPLATAVGVARAVSSLLNFGLNRGPVFRSDRPVVLSLGLYYALVVAIAALSYAATRGLMAAGVPAVVAKAGADSVLFVASFFVQRAVVFRRPA